MDVQRSQRQAGQRYESRMDEFEETSSRQALQLLTEAKIELSKLIGEKV